jgi:hypothetical protein
MRSPFLFCLFLLAALPAAAQPAPGAGLSVTLSGGHAMSSDLEDGGSVDVSRSEVGVGYRVYSDSNSSARLTFAREDRWYTFSAGAGLLAELPEHATAHRLGLMGAGRISDPWTWMASPVVQSATLGDGALEDSLNFRLLSLATRRVSDRFSWSVGFIARTRLEDSGRVIPIAGIQWRITDRLELRTTDEISLAYGLDSARRWRLEGNATFRVWEYRMEESYEEWSAGVFVDERVFGTLGLRFQPHPGFSARVHAGLSMWNDIKVEDRDGRTLDDREADPAPYAGLDVALRF